jgi:hypothetical protein
MATIVADTHKLITKLSERGFTRVQAEALTEALQELDFSELVTKANLKELEIKLTKEINSLSWKISGLLLAQGALVVAILQFFQ